MAVSELMSARVFFPYSTFYILKKPVKESNEILMSNIKSINYSDIIVVFKNVCHYFSLQLQNSLKFPSMKII